MADRDKAQADFARLLLERIRRDSHPSATEMTMLEQCVPHEMLGEYYEVLLEKVLVDKTPSMTMLRRLQRVTQQL